MALAKDFIAFHDASGVAYGRLLRGIDRLRRRDLVEVRRDEGRPPVVRFRHDLDSHKLEVKPLSIVTEGDVIRLTL